MTTTSANGGDTTSTNPIDTPSTDPFASQRTTDNNPFQESESPGDKLGGIAGSDDMRLSSSPPGADRRMSKEWDASKVPPSRFQRREGSIYATPNSRDSHTKGSSRDKAYFDKLKEKGWVPSSTTK